MSHTPSRLFTEARAPGPKSLADLAKAQCGLGDQMAQETGLAAAIEELRQELYKAQDEGADQQFAFVIEEAALELQLELRKTGKGKKEKEKKRVKTFEHGRHLAGNIRNNFVRWWLK